MRALELFIRTVTKISWALAIIGITGLVVLSCSIAADVIMRYCFNAPITGVRDLLSLFIAVCVGLTMPVLLLKEGNIAVDFIVLVVGKKIGSILAVLANILTACIFTGVAWEVWKAAEYMGENNEVTQVMGVPLEPWWTLVSACFLFASIAALAPIINGLRDLSTPKEA